MLRELIDTFAGLIIANKVKQSINGNTTLCIAGLPPPKKKENVL
jgi:hypothetical protein